MQMWLISIPRRDEVHWYTVKNGLQQLTQAAIMISLIMATLVLAFVFEITAHVNLGIHFHLLAMLAVPMLHTVALWRHGRLRVRDFRLFEEKIN